MKSKLARREASDHTRRHEPTPDDAERIGKQSLLGLEEQVAPHHLTAAREVIRGARLDGTADTVEPIRALQMLVSRPETVFTAEKFIATGSIDRDADTREWAPVIAGLNADAKRAYEIVVARRGGALGRVLSP